MSQSQRTVPADIADEMDRKKAIKKRNVRRWLHRLYFAMFYALGFSALLLTWQWLTPLLPARCNIESHWYCIFSVTIPGTFQSGWWGLPALGLTSVVIFIAALLPCLLGFALILTKQLKGYDVVFDGAPAFARINTPHENANKDKLKIKLPDDTKYTITRCHDGFFLLMHNWQVTVTIPEKGEIDLIIPAKTETDFASIPRFLHGLINPLTNNIYAAVLHDYLYRDPKETAARNVSKKKADALLYHGMRGCGVGRLMSSVIFLGVFIGGHWSYKRSD